MTVEILTPEKKFFSGEAESILMPGADGKFEILKDHAPLISSLKEGEIRIRQNVWPCFLNKRFVSQCQRRDCGYPVLSDRFQTRASG